MANMISSINLCKVPITPTHQLDFNSVSEQRQYFESNVVFTYPKCKYQPRTSTIKVKGYVDQLQQANYGFYTNTYKGTNKTFYFWIVSKNLLAKETTELTIQIDVFQTWHFEFYMSQCMVEREHVSNDDLWKNTIPEDFELGEYVASNRKALTELTGDPYFCIGVTDSSESIIGGIFGKTYSGFTITCYHYSSKDKLSDYIQSLMENGKADSIAFIFTFPGGLADFRDETTFVGVEGTLQKEVFYNWNSLDKNFTTYNDSYKPFNNKLYTYPYCFLTIKNPSGGNVVLKFENFQNPSQISFLLESVLTQNPTISLTPRNYAGKSFSIEDSITLNEYGLCSWNNDNYSNWYAQHVNSINAQSLNAGYSMRANRQVADNNFNNALDRRNTNALKGGISTAISTVNSLASMNFLGAVGNAVGGGANTMLDYTQASKNASNDLSNSVLLNNTSYQNEIRSIVGSVKDAQVQPNTAKGDTSSSGLDLARDTATFFLEQTHIKPEYARIIDMYFQMFGYQVNTVKKPNLRGRARWNYVKTVNCTTYGEIPHEDTDELNNIFNNGLTIWHDESYMYKYDIENPII